MAGLSAQPGARPGDRIALTERPDCVCCGSGAWARLLSVPYHSPEMDRFLATYYAGRLSRAAVAGDYELRQCRRCGMVWQAWVPDPPSMGVLYERAISPQESLRKRTEAGHDYYRWLVTDAGMIGRCFPERLPRDIRVLDFGMGWGHWCRAAQAHGYDVVGAELSGDRIDHAGRWGIEVCSDVEALPDGRFDCINTDQVIEHVPDPDDVVALLARLLAPGGVLKIAVPNAARELRALRRGKWQPGKGALQPLEHVNCFRRRPLDRLARRHGLRPLPFPWARLAHLPPGRRAVRFAYHRWGGTFRYYRKPAQAAHG